MRLLAAPGIFLLFCSMATKGQGTPVGPYLGEECKGVYAGFNVTYPEIVSPQIDAVVAQVILSVYGRIPW